MSVEKNKKIVWEYLIDKGFSEESSAGIMGNIQAESGFKTDAENEIGAFGLFQWLGSRKDSLLAFANRQGKSVDDINVQLDFFWSELQGSEKATFDSMYNGNHSAEEYAVIFEEKFERSGGSNISGRKEYAGEIFKQFTGTYSEGGGTDQKEEQKSLVWWGDIVRVIFAVSVIAGGVAFLGLAVTSTGKTGAKAVNKVKETVKEVVKDD